MLNDPAIWDMFRAEVDTHMASLNDGLLALERDPMQGSQFEPLMRAAHSIKGAAKIMGVSAAVEIAHAIEDCFVAAREGRLTMSSSLVDVLFRGVDLLGTVAQREALALDEATVGRVREVVQNIASVMHGQPLNPQPTIKSSSALPNQRDRQCDSPMILGRSFDANWIETHSSQLTALFQSDTSAVHLDFSMVESVDPLGLAILSQLVDQAARHGSSGPITIHLHGVSGRWARFLQATGVDRTCQLKTTGD